MSGVSNQPLSAQRSDRSQRARITGRSLWANAEPWLWLNGAGLVISIAMVIGLLILVVYQGMTTFWPLPLVQITTVDGDVLMGEITRSENYRMTYGAADNLTGKSQETALQRLNAAFHQQLRDLAKRDSLAARIGENWQTTSRNVAAIAGTGSDPGTAMPDNTARYDRRILARLDAKRQQIADTITSEISTAVDADHNGAALWSLWQTYRDAADQWQATTDSKARRDILDEDSSFAHQLVGAQVMAGLGATIRLPSRRRLLRIGNFELTNEHFRWISDFEIAPDGTTNPQWGMLLERLTWGRFYGVPTAFRIGDQTVAATPADAWDQFTKYHAEVRRRWRQRRHIEERRVGDVNYALEQARLQLRNVELQFSKGSPQYVAAARDLAAHEASLQKEFQSLRAEIDRLDQENDRYRIVMRTSDGQTTEVPLASIVRAYLPNQIDGWQSCAIYGSRWWEFLSDDPRAANSEGGVFPAIWGTVVMTVLMSLLVVPFGVLAALYLREYARAGLLVSIVRISVNNLAGVPSIVFGVFGLGFFCYIIGASIDELFYPARLPSPTFGTGGLLWASLTLALLTLPVVIVATEEALAAVPRSMREGSLACGATTWQTIRRIVLPRALPGIMTGMILAMARGAGEVAPLMLVGAVKLAPELPVDHTFPYVHLQRSFMHLGFHIYDLGFQSQNSEAAKPMVFTTTLLLILLIATMNVFAIWLRARLRRRFAYGKM